MDYKNVISFVAGLGLGAGITYLIMKKREESAIDEEYYDEDDISDEEYHAAEHIREMAESFREENEKAVSDIVEGMRDNVVYFPNENEKRKEAMYKKYFSNEEGDDLAGTTVTTTGDVIKAAEVISPIQFFEDEYDDDGELIEKAEDPLIYFADGVLINTDDAEPYEPVSEETCEEYLNLEEVTKHFGEYGEENVVYIRCFEKPVTDYKIVKENVSFMNSQWYSGEDEE